MSLYLRFILISQLHVFLCGFVQLPKQRPDFLSDLEDVSVTTLRFSDEQLLVLGYIFKHLNSHQLVIIDKGSSYVENPINLLQWANQGFFHGLELFENICLQIKILLENKVCMIVCTDDFSGLLELGFQIIRVRL